MRRLPATTAAATALRSAQTDNGYELFSTLQPAKMRPSASTAAPTRKREYGAQALRRARAAARSSSEIGAPGRRFTRAPAGGEPPRTRGG